MTRSLDLDALLEDARASDLSDAFFTTRLRGIDRDAAREQVLSRITAPELDQTDAVVLGRTLAALDPTSALDRMFEVMGDEAIDDNGRLACFQALLSVSPETVAAYSHRDPRHGATIEFLSLYSTLVSSHEHPEALDTLHALARQVPTEFLRAWVEVLDAVRQRANVAASVAYAKLLGDPTFAADDAVRTRLLDALVAEADEAGVALLQRLRARAPKKLRAPFQVALLKLETARIGGSVKGAADTARAWCTQPDGQGAVVTLFALANPDGTSTFINLCFRLGRDLRQGFVVARAREREVNDTLAQLTAGEIEVTRVPVGELATIVDEAAASHARMGVKTPAECVAPLAAIKRLPRAPLVELPTPVSVSRERVAEILDGDRYLAWYFDDADLDANAFGAVGRDNALAALARSPVCGRVETMARFMARWVRWRGEEAHAAEWGAIADDVARDFASSALAGAMADVSPIDEPGATSDYGVEGVLFPFRELFPEIAQRETRSLRFEGHKKIPDGEYLLEESYCTARKCDCERVTFHVIDAGRRGAPFRIGHAFTPAAAKRFYSPQTEVDPTSGPPPWAKDMAREVAARMKSDAAWRADVERHYQLSRTL